MCRENLAFVRIFADLRLIHFKQRAHICGFDIHTVKANVIQRKQHIFWGPGVNEQELSGLLKKKYVLILLFIVYCNCFESSKQRPDTAPHASLHQQIAC